MGTLGGAPCTPHPCPGCRGLGGGAAGAGVGLWSLGSAETGRLRMTVLELPRERVLQPASSVPAVWAARRRLGGEESPFL